MKLRLLNLAAMLAWALCCIIEIISIVIAIVIFSWAWAGSLPLAKISGPIAGWAYNARARSMNNLKLWEGFDE
jgi:hypothetical protein